MRELQRKGRTSAATDERQRGGRGNSRITAVVKDERGVPAAVIAGKLRYYDGPRKKRDVTLGHSCG